MARYRLLIAYDGTEYHGWQRQQGLTTITGMLEKKFFAVFKREGVIVGASRTDAGVHAAGQVAMLTTPLTIEPSILQSAWRNALPRDIVIRSISRLDQPFHPQANVKQKTYYYFFSLAMPLPFIHRYVWHYRFPVDIEKLKKLVHCFVGTYDFRAFCSLDVDDYDTVRTIDAIEVDYLPEDNIYRIKVCGQRFMRHMVRRLAGALIETASRPYLNAETLYAVLCAKDPEHTLPNAPAHGLTLHEISYNE